jgi:hypothetical protein
MAEEPSREEKGPQKGQKITKEESQMKYLEKPGGDSGTEALVVVSDGEVCEIGIGSRVRLFNDTGKCLFAWEDRDGKSSETEFVVSKLVDGTIALRGFTFTFMVTINSSLVKDGLPYVQSIISTKWASDFDLVLEKSAITVYPNAAYLDNEEGGDGGNERD